MTFFSSWEKESRCYCAKVKLICGQLKDVKSSVCVCLILRLFVAFLFVHYEYQDDDDVMLYGQFEDVNVLRVEMKYECLQL